MQKADFVALIGIVEKQYGHVLVVTSGGFFFFLAALLSSDLLMGLTRIK